MVNKKRYIFMALGSMFLFSTFGIYGKDGSGSPLDEKPGEELSYLQLVDSADYKLGLEEWASGERLLLQALRKEPANSGNTLLLSNLGVAQMQQGKYRDAIASFDVALIRAPRSSTILTNRAKAHLAMGDYVSALEGLDRLLEIDSKSEWPLETRGLIYLSMPDRIKEAESDFRQLISVNDENPWGYFGLGAIAELEQDIPKAEEYFRQAYSRDQDPEICFRLASSYLRQKKLEEGSAVLRKALREHPRNGNLLAVMGWYHKLTYQKQESEADLKLAEEYGATPELVRWIREGLE